MWHSPQPGSSPHRSPLYSQVDILHAPLRPWSLSQKKKTAGFLSYTYGQGYRGPPKHFPNEGLVHPITLDLCWPKIWQFCKSDGFLGGWWVRTWPELKGCWWPANRGNKIGHALNHLGTWGFCFFRFFFQKIPSQKSTEALDDICFRNPS